MNLEKERQAEEEVGIAAWVHFCLAMLEEDGCFPFAWDRFGTAVDEDVDCIGIDILGEALEDTSLAFAFDFEAEAEVEIAHPRRHPLR